MQMEFAMPRKPRMYLPEIPAHIVQRGNNREPCFFAEDDYRFYLDRLGKALKRYHVKCHAYVLMTNHVHLLLTPSDEIGISKVMSLLGQHLCLSGIIQSQTDRARCAYHQPCISL